MNYDSNGATYRENKGFSSKYDSKFIRREIGDKIDYQKFADAEIERKKARAILEANEKGYTQQLLELGKLCCFVEAFDNIALNEQQISPVGPFENPVECESFKNGYQRGITLVDNGFSEQNYRDFVSHYEQKYINKNSKQK